MNENTDIHSLPTPLFGLIGSLGHCKYGWYHHFETGSLFWSLTRLFGLYHRIISAVALERNNRAFLESDIENFIIWTRIVLNDIAFIIRQLLPDQVQGLKGPKGGTHPKNKEMSMVDIFKYFSKNPNEIPELTAALNKNKGWIFRLKEQRDNIVHYKSKVIIFETEPDISFAMLNAAGTEKTVSTDDGKKRIVMIPIFEFINSQMVSLHNFLHKDLYSAVKDYITRNGIDFREIGSNPRMSCLGIEIFKKVNNITT
jgi:hypothetical protein